MVGSSAADDASGRRAVWIPLCFYVSYLLFSVSAVMPLPFSFCQHLSFMLPAFIFYTTVIHLCTFTARSNKRHVTYMSYSLAAVIFHASCRLLALL